MFKLGLRALAVIFMLFALTSTAEAQLIKNSSITTAGADCSTATRCVTLSEGDLRGVVSIGVYVDVGTSGTFNFEYMVKDGVWQDAPDDVNDSPSVTADAARFFSNPGYRSFRIRASAINGAANIQIFRGYAGLRSTASLSGGGGDGAIQDGADAGIEQTVFDYTNSNPSSTIIVEPTTGDPIDLSSIGGGQQYTEADTDASITGNALMLEGAGNTLVAAPGTAADGLLVNLGSNNDVTVTGTVTANLSATDNAVLDDIADGIAVTATNLDVQIGGSDTVAVSNAGLTELAAAINSNLVDVNIVSGAGSGGTAQADGADFTADTTQGTPAQGVYESTPTNATDGDLATFGSTIKRAMRTSLENATGTSAFGTAGSASAAVLTIQGIASGTVVPVSATNLDVQIGGSDTVTVAATNLDVQIGGSDTVAVSNAALTELAAAINSDILDINVAQIGGSTPAEETTADFDTGGGTATRAAIGLAVPASGGPAIVPGDATDGLKVQLPAATVAHLSNLATYLQPGTGALIRSDNTNNDDETQIKGTAGVLLSVSGRNAHATTAAYVRCTNLTAANTTPGSSTVIYEMVIPPATLGFVQSNFGPAGRTFDTALTCYIATGKAVSDATDAAEDDVVVNITYR